MPQNQQKDSQLDYSILKAALLPPTSYKLKDVEHKIRKIAYDVVRFVDGPNQGSNQNIDNLWQIKTDSNGDEIIVALYDEPTVIEKTASQPTSNWQVQADQAYLSIWYKEKPVTKLSLASLNIAPNEAYLTVESLPTKLASEPSLVKSLLGDLSFEHRGQLCANFPELAV